jgi:hypothetical protein
MDAAARSVTLVTTAQTPTAVVAETANWDDFPNRWRPLLDEVWAFVRGPASRPGGT